MTTSFMIAAPSSGAGKTTITRGMMALFTSKGMEVQPFKCGPDYIDTKFHELVCGRPSINLDTFMASPGHQLGMENGHKVGQHGIRLHRGDFVIRRLLHVAVDDMAVFECLEQGVTRLG